MNISEQSLGYNWECSLTFKYENSTQKFAEAEPARKSFVLTSQFVTPVSTPLKTCTSKFAVSVLPSLLPSEPIFEIDRHQDRSLISIIICVSPVKRIGNYRLESHSYSISDSPRTLLGSSSRSLLRMAESHNTGQGPNDDALAQHTVPEELFPSAESPILMKMDVSHNENDSETNSEPKRVRADVMGSLRHCETKQKTSNDRSKPSLQSAKLIYRELFSGAFPTSKEVIEMVLQAQGVNVGNIEAILFKIFQKEHNITDENVFIVIIAVSYGRFEELFLRYLCCNKCVRCSKTKKWYTSCPATKIQESAVNMS